MERNTARSYIEAMIQQTTREGVEDQVAEMIVDDTGSSHAERARITARDGLVYLTASHLRQATTLTTRQRGYLLAEAHRKYAGRKEFDAERESHLPFLHQERNQQEAQRSRRIAQGLTRAVKRA